MNTKTKKVLNITLKVLSWILVAFTVFMMVFTIVTVTTVDKDDRSIFGIKFYIVLSDSMSKSENNKDMDVHFNAGDIVLIKDLSFEEKCKLEPGDIISFTSMNESDKDTYWKTITHMIREVQVDSKGNVSYVTFGTNTGTNDENAVSPGEVKGKYMGKIPQAGNFFAFVKSVPGYIVCILVPFLLLILYNGVDVIRLFRRYKKEQMDVMQAEKDQIEADRAENQRMMQELLALKAQLEQKGSDPTQEAAPEAVAEEAIVENTTEPVVAESNQVEETSSENEEVSNEAEAPAQSEEISEETQETTSDLDESNEDPVEDQNGEPVEEQIKEDSEAQPPIEEPASEANSEEESTEEPNAATEEEPSPTEETPDEN